MKGWCPRPLNDGGSPEGAAHSMRVGGHVKSPEGVFKKRRRVGQELRQEIPRDKGYMNNSDISAKFEKDVALLRAVWALVLLNDLERALDIFWGIRYVSEKHAFRQILDLFVQQKNTETIRKILVTSKRCDDCIDIMNMIAEAMARANDNEGLLLIPQEVLKHKTEYDSVCLMVLSNLIYLTRNGSGYVPYKYFDYTSYWNLH